MCFDSNRMDSHTSESETVNAAETLLSTSPGAASTGSRERMDSDSSDRYVNSEQGKCLFLLFFV